MIGLLSAHRSALSEVQHPAAQSPSAVGDQAQGIDVNLGGTDAHGGGIVQEEWE